MGYTHYLQRPLEIKNFQDISTVTKSCCEVVKSLGINIVGGTGESDSEPEFSSELICFNGDQKQTPGVWTADGDFGIVWPSDKSKPTPTTDSVVSGQWFGGASVEKRVAPNGDGSYETLYIPRVYEAREWEHLDENSNYFSFCKTAYRPYDILVMCAYASVKFYDRRSMVSSDGEVTEWKIAVGMLSQILKIEEEILWNLLNLNL
ncbi:MAG: hypothetical protein AB4080_16935 [Trichodesmium sp.]